MKQYKKWNVCFAIIDSMRNRFYSYSHRTPTLKKRQLFLPKTGRNILKVIILSIFHVALVVLQPTLALLLANHDFDQHEAITSHIIKNTNTKYRLKECVTKKAYFGTNEAKFNKWKAVKIRKAIVRSSLFQSDW